MSRSRRADVEEPVTTDDASGPRRERSSAPPTVRRLWRPDLYLPLLAAVVFLAAWEAFGRAVNPILFAPPSRVAQAFVEMTADGTLPRAFLTTMNALVVGYLLAVVVGLAGGVLLGRNRTIADLVEPYIDAVYATPRVVIVPLVIIWFGVGYVGRVFIVWIGTVIPIILNTAIGVRNARPDLIEVARSFGASERDLIRHVIIPGSVPYIVAGLRIAAGRALVGVIVAEIFLDLTGLGGIIQTESQFFRTANMLVAVAVIAALGAIIIGALGALERRFASWRESSAI
jgi:ABC-type nitrate/sulfonate/bicarbonate transport system permease component